MKSRILRKNELSKQIHEESISSYYKRKGRKNVYVPNFITEIFFSLVVTNYSESSNSIFSMKNSTCNVTTCLANFI